jgi:hypothetical protein
LCDCSFIQALKQNKKGQIDKNKADKFGTRKTVGTRIKWDLLSKAAMVLFTSRKQVPTAFSKGI